MIKHVDIDADPAYSICPRCDRLVTCGVNPQSLDGAVISCTEYRKKR